MEHLVAYDLFSPANLPYVAAADRGGQGLSRSVMFFGVAKGKFWGMFFAI
jgi:hypothetical protein